MTDEPPNNLKQDVGKLQGTVEQMIRIITEHTTSDLLGFAAVREDGRHDREIIAKNLAINNQLFTEKLNKLENDGLSREKKIDEAIKKLDSFLDKGAGAIWAVGIMVSVGGLIGAVVTWAIDHFTIGVMKGH